ncbi:hypothetical protein Mth01_48600 [Sphaerimonospora thailandensis]|uniref:Uncharacterized protein n=1 Tax=Sphaerimonospora thailandensis TaxID=795644 RepID=A0A8J3RBF3_9ACTN|nr:hypothetical protein Mth01_48600 [Sphaerimonospora thailandensis]
MTTFDALRGQLLDAAEAFSGGGDTLSGILAGMVDDVDRMLREELEIFPVCHHSPASALAMTRRLRTKRPKVVYLELCEDLRPLLDELRNCRLPVALQAFATQLDGFPPGSGPLSVVAPVTEASAEYQAIAYALDTPGVELVLVDRSVDHVFQWLPGEPDGTASSGVEGVDGEEAALHGDAVGVEIGDLRPRFAELEAHLLHHGKVRHWSEWWDQYVEQPLTGADYDTYRQAMALIGSLFRRLRPTEDDRLAIDEERERYMWTRIREHLTASGADPADCLYVCGAFHAVSRVAEFGLAADAPPYAISPRTGTRWLYGLIPSSHSAIEAQFGLAQGSVSIAAATWAKAGRRGGVTPYRLEGQQGGRTRTKTVKTVKGSEPPATAGPAGDRLSGFLAAPPVLDGLDEDELRGWCVDIVRLARRGGYLASTADAIAVFETSILLAGLRGRARPTPYDFADAAVTCIEKDVVPGRRDVRRLCEILLGGDRIGAVGYDALPPLARDVYDRLEPLGLDLSRRTQQRVLLDLKANPELEPCSDVLWKLRYLLPDGAVRPIMGVRRLGERPIQESWDLAIGRHQRSIIELGYEGVTVEQVLEQRLRRTVWEPQATAGVALTAVADAILYLGGRRFADEFGNRAVELLATERTVDDAPEVLRRIRRLLAHYRATEPELPAWCEAFVTVGYAHYCTLLPTAFADDDTGVRQVGAMLGFLFTLESLALSLGCDRAQLELAVRQSHPEAPAKVALLWAAKTQLGLLPRDELRARCDELLSNPLVVPAFPLYLSGFVQALEPVPALAPFVVEALSKAFARLPDPVLLPWLPTLIMTLRKHVPELVPVLVREAGRTFPGGLAELDAWTPPWERPAVPIRQGRQTGEAGAAPGRSGPAAALLARHPQACDAVAALLGCPAEWPAAEVPEPGQVEVRELLARHPTTTGAIAALLDR